MRYISTSGGWTIGSIDSPTIDIIPAPGTPPVKRSEIDALLDQPFSWSHISRTERRLNPLLRSQQGIVGFNPRVIVRFIYPKGTTLLDALYTIEAVEHQAGESPPATVFGQILGAARGLQHHLPPLHVTQVAHILGKMCSTIPGRGPTGRLRSRDIERLVDRAITYLLSYPTEERYDFVPASPVGRARFWLAFSKQLWLPRVLRGLASYPTSNEAKWQELRGVAQIAGLHLYLARQDYVEVQGIPIPTTHADPPLIWLQVVEWTAGDIPPAALQRFAGLGIRTPWPEISHSKKPPDKEVSARARAIAEAFLEEARTRGRYAPTGFFHLSLPPQIPLTRWGVTGLRIWASPDELWVQVLGEGETPGPVFEWTPASSPRAVVLSPHSIPLVHATLAALWHDLTVAHEKAFPSHRRRKMPGQRERATISKVRPRAARFPRTVYTISGRRTWGSEVDRTVIRQTHGVREHLRRLPHDHRPSEEAKRRALAFGYILPAGHTFVRPHVRGQKDASGEAESSRTTEAQPVTARGLVTLATLLGEDQHPPP